MKARSICFLIVALTLGACSDDGRATPSTLAVTTTAPTATTASTTSTLVTPSTTTTPTSPSTTTAIDPVTIMPIGDSITQGSRGWHTYRCHLDGMLKRAGTSFDLVGGLAEPFNGPPYGCPADFDMDHEGRWGWRVDQVIEVVYPSVESQQPDIALIHLGTNDILQGQDATETAGELGELITGLQAVRPDITVLIAQIIPCLPSECTTNVPALNAAIVSLEALSTAESAVIVVDMETDYEADHLRDGVHPTDEGDRLIASRWIRAMQERGLL